MTKRVIPIKGTKSTTSQLNKLTTSILRHSPKNTRPARKTWLDTWDRCPSRTAKCAVAPVPAYSQTISPCTRHTTSACNSRSDSLPCFPYSHTVSESSHPVPPEGIRYTDPVAETFQHSKGEERHVTDRLTWSVPYFGFFSTISRNVSTNCSRTLL